jgi:hypothetical protein
MRLVVAAIVISAMFASAMFAYEAVQTQKAKDSLTRLSMLFDALMNKPSMPYDLAAMERLLWKP